METISLYAHCLRDWLCIEITYQIGMPNAEPAPNNLYSCIDVTTMLFMNTSTPPEYLQNRIRNAIGPNMEQRNDPKSAARCSVEQYHLRYLSQVTYFLLQTCRVDIPENAAQ